MAAEKRHVPICKLTHGPRHHWFGYYDKYEFDLSDRRLLGMEVDFEHRSPSGNDEIRIGVMDRDKGYAWRQIGTSRAWSWQQGCMLQWRPGRETEVLWNDRSADRHVCHILDVESGAQRTLDHPVYTLSPDGKTALTLDFRRINDTRPGYGYAGLPDPNVDKLAPEDSGIWRVDLDTGDAELILSLAQVTAIPYAHEDLSNAKHWFNHLLFNPDGSRFVFLHRWRPDRGRGRWRNSRMFTANPDGSELRLVTDGEGRAISHFIWRDPQHLNVWVGCRKAFTILPDDGSERMEVLLECNDGHQSYLPGGEWMVYDHYPYQTGDRPLNLLHVPTGRQFEIGRFESPPQYTGEWRCDLHPRHSRDGNSLVIDSAHESDGRQMYMLDISELVS
jgi:hypothetical protein